MRATAVVRCALLRSGTLSLGIAVALASSGCPQRLSDDFERVAAAGAGAAAGNDGSAGDAGAGGGSGAPSGMGGAGGVAGSAGTAGGVGGTGGASPSGGASGSDALPTCDDSSLNQGESGIDCGGPCAPCACTWSSFSAPEPLIGLGADAAQSSWGPSLSSDALTLVFSSGSPEDLFVATRGARGPVFSAASPLPGDVNSDTDEGTAFISADGLRLYFFSRSDSESDRDIFVATRADLSSAFGGASPVPGINGPSSDHLPWVSSDELRFYFSSSRDSGAGGYDLWQASRADRDDAFGEPSALTELNGAGDDSGGSLTADELTIFFASDRAGLSDIWVATRPSREEPFSPPVEVLELNTDASELNPSISADGSELIFSTNRGGASNELWRATRTCD